MAKDIITSKKEVPASGCLIKRVVMALKPRLIVLPI